MDKKTRNLIIKHLRRASLQWSVRNEVYKYHRTRYPIGFYKNGNIKYKVMNWCNICGVVSEAKIEIDHILEIGKDWNKNWHRSVNRLFCGRENLQGLCHDCHVTKSQEWQSVLEDL